MINSTTPCICCDTSFWNINVGKQRVTISYLVGRSVATYLTCSGVATKLRKVNRFLTHSVVFAAAIAYCLLTNTLCYSVHRMISGSWSTYKQHGLNVKISYAQLHISPSSFPHSFLFSFSIICYFFLIFVFLLR